ncbi:hypothetical protein PMPD1_1341 [Paramixta manurensis]|uniref:Lipoprotein n=1 Tax=Paramixta manurensis TaxID=2740817 RepID=A0A6M8UF05_9GAMM|nr:hypothetical protein PMPD1_1341 [Erwiniaceae bacterium PD-1]
MNKTIATVLALSLSALTTSVYADSVKTGGKMLADQAGMTLYTFDNDTAGSGKSVCNDACAKLWPPVIADAGAQPQGELTLVKRDSGEQQWAWKGKPLYRFVKDAKPGEMKGDNVKGIWHVVMP